MEQKKQPSHIIAVAQLKLVLVLILILMPRLVFTHSCKKCDVGNGHISRRATCRTREFEPSPEKRLLGYPFPSSVPIFHRFCFLPVFLEL